MATDRVAFIPWNRSQAGRFIQEYEDNVGGRVHHKRRWSIVCLDTPGKPLADVGFGFGTRIHIAGHGSIGWGSIAADHGTGGANLTVAEVVERMFDQGLKKYYLGTIACDVCYSALGNPPFAKLLARELWSKGVKASCVLGYKGSMVATYTNELEGALGGNKNHKYKHRIVDIEEDEHGNPTKSVKSKYAQARFVGWD